MGIGPIKSEHSGAKSGGGYWGPRKDAKSFSKVRRRQNGRASAAEGLMDLVDEDSAGSNVTSHPESSLRHRT